MQFIKIVEIPSSAARVLGDRTMWALVLPEEYHEFNDTIVLARRPDFYICTPDGNSEEYICLDGDEDFITVRYSDVVGEDENASENEGFFGQFTLRGWSTPYNLSSVQRHRARLGRNSGGQTGEMDMSSSFLQQPRSGNSGSLLGSLRRSSAIWDDAAYALSSAQEAAVSSALTSSWSVRVSDSEGSDTTETRRSVAQAQMSDAERSDEIRRTREFITSATARYTS